MSTTVNVLNEQENVKTVEDAIRVVRAVLGDVAKIAMVVSGVVDGEVSGVVLGDGEDEDYVDGVELAAGVSYLIVGVGKLPTTQRPGVVVLKPVSAV